MERLTNTEIDYSEIGVVENMRTSILSAGMCRLTAYENMGLSPKEVHDMMTDWVVWKQAEAEGRMVVLPCKVGDTAFYIDCGKSYKMVVKSIRINESGLRIYGERNYMGVVAFEGIYGKTVFQTREEAEAALNALEEKDEH